MERCNLSPIANETVYIIFTPVKREGEQVKCICVWPIYSKLSISLLCLSLSRSLSLPLRIVYTQRLINTDYTLYIYLLHNLHKPQVRGGTTRVNRKIKATFPLSILLSQLSDIEGWCCRRLSLWLKPPGKEKVYWRRLSQASPPPL